MVSFPTKDVICIYFFSDSFQILKFFSRMNSINERTANITIAVKTICGIRKTES